MISTPRFSVIIPAYNKAETLQRAVRSVRSQDYTNWELCIVVDPSDDGTEAIARQLADTITILLFRDAAGPGGYAARNAGIANTSGEIVAFLDADDEWYPAHLHTLDRVLRQYPDQSLVVSNYTRVMEDSSIRENPYGRQYRPSGDRVVSVNEYLRRAYRGLDLFRTSTLAVRRSALSGPVLFPEHRCTRAGDSDAFLRLLVSCGSLVWSSAVTARYHRDAPSMVTKLLAPQLQHCTRTTISRLVREVSSRRTRANLKRFHNLKAKGPLHRKARRGLLRVRDLGRLYTAYDLSWILNELIVLFVFRVRVLIDRIHE